MSELEQDNLANKVADAVYIKIADEFTKFMENIETGQNGTVIESNIKLDGLKTDIEDISKDIIILKKRNSNRAIAKRVIIAVVVALIVGAIVLFIFYPWIDTHFAIGEKPDVMFKRTFDTLEAQRERGYAGTTRSIPMGSIINNDSLLTEK